MEDIVKFSQFVKDINSPVIKQLVYDFGYDVVFCKDKIYSLNDDLLKKIFNSLNKSFFNNVIPIISLKCMTFTEIKNELTRREEKNIEKLENSFYGVFNVLLKNENIKDIHRVDDIVLGDDIIMMNSDMTSSQSFIFLVSCVCHEMIHAYMRFNGEYANLIFESLDNLDDLDTHSSKEFKHMMYKANKMRINVVDKINKPDPILNVNAYKLLTTGKTIYESRKSLLEKEGQLDLGDLIIYDNGKKAAILCID